MVPPVAPPQDVADALRHSEERYRSLVIASAQVVWTTTPSGEIDGDLPEWRALTGQSLEEIQGLGWLNAIHPDDRQHVSEVWDEAIRTSTIYNTEYRVRRHDGSYSYFAARGVPVREPDGRVREWVGTCTDIDERRQAEQALAFLAETSSILAASLDYETTLTTVARLAVPHLADWCAIDIVENGTIRRLVVEHVDPGKIALAHELQQRYPPNPNATQGVYNVLRTGKSELMAELPDGLLVAAARDAEHLALIRALGVTSYMVVPLLARDEVLGTLTLVSSESGRRFGRTHLAHAEEVARRAALAVDNARLYREAQTAIREREVILSVASHELKNPLTALMGYARLLDSRAVVGRPMSERDVRGVRTIAEQGERLNQMLDLLLDIARIESGRLRLEQAPVDLGELIQRMVAEIEPGLSEHTISFQPPDAPLIVHGDTVRLEQVFRNLLNNAVKYSPQGGLVEASVERQDSSVVVAVRDEGIGIASDALPYLFQRFYRAPQEDVQQLGGLGVGLYVVREIVTLHGGSVDVASTEGEGSTFTVALPLHQPEPSGDE